MGAGVTWRRQRRVFTSRCDKSAVDQRPAGLLVYILVWLYRTARAKRHHHNQGQQQVINKHYQEQNYFFKG